MLRRLIASVDELCSRAVVVGVNIPNIPIPIRNELKPKIWW